jgi:hypothetical protein
MLFLERLVVSTRLAMKDRDPSWPTSPPRASIPEIIVK